MPDQLSNLKIAYIQSCWHKEIVDRCRNGFCDRLSALDFPASSVEFFQVPGAFEIPLKIKQLAGQEKYHAFVAAGFIVDGGIYRHEFVAQSVISALMQVQLELEVPVISAVLTPRNFHESREHREFFHDHMHLKGEEAADAALALLESKRPFGPLRQHVPQQQRQSEK